MSLFFVINSLCIPEDPEQSNIAAPPFSNRKNKTQRDKRCGNMVSCLSLGGQYEKTRQNTANKYIPIRNLSLYKVCSKSADLS